MKIPLHDQYSAAVAGIVKGIIERGDEFYHFGSTLAGKYWIEAASEAGFIGDGKITAVGELWYKQQKMADLKDCRAYFWPKRDWSFDES